MKDFFLDLELAGRLADHVDSDLPSKNCSCHNNPPCSDCVDYGGLREAVATVRQLQAEREKSLVANRESLITRYDGPFDSELAILKMQLATAEQHAEELSASVSVAREAVVALTRKLIKLHWGVEPGTLVQVAYVNSLNPAPKPGLWKVTRVRAEFKETRRPWVEAVKQKKDGSWGVKPRMLFNDWVAAEVES